MLKDVAPSESLREWFDHDTDKWSEFNSCYLKELSKGSDELQKIARLCCRWPRDIGVRIKG